MMRNGLAAAFGLIAAAGLAPQAAAAPQAVVAPPLPPPPTNGEMGFIFTGFAPTIYQGKDDCPAGLIPPLRDLYLATLPGSEKARLLRKENETELTTRWQAYAVGPDNTNICSNPQLFDHPPTPTLMGKVAYGLDLDDDAGDGAATGCAHRNFTTPEGEAGIDNQAWRVMGCAGSWRGTDPTPGAVGDIVRGLNGFLISGEHSQVMLLRGVDSLTDDPDVDVIYANTEDRAVVDGRQQFVAGASFTVTDKPQYRNVLKGRIVNGVLTTTAADIRLRQTWGQGGNRDIRGARTEWNLRRARLRLAFQPDGSLKGVVGGYQPLWNVMQSPSLGGIGAATTAGYDCAGMYAALKRMADGDRDPKSGQCSTISSAMDATAIPAFITDRVPAQKSAAK